MNLTFGISAYSCCSAALSGPSPTKANRVLAGKSFKMVFKALRFFSVVRKQPIDFLCNNSGAVQVLQLRCNSSACQQKCDRQGLIILKNLSRSGAIPHTAISLDSRPAGSGVAACLHPNLHICCRQGCASWMLASHSIGCNETEEDAGRQDTDLPLVGQHAPAGGPQGGPHSAFPSSHHTYMMG